MTCCDVNQICLELPTTLPDQSWLAIACFLVDHGADLDAVDIRGNTPITHIKNDAVIDLLRKRARSAIVKTTVRHPVAYLGFQ